MYTIDNYIKIVNQKLEEYFVLQYPEKIFDSMKYTVTLPGKRLRPIFCLETCRILGGKIEDAMPTACAIEMLHAQTLIHDDLPCMDNDDYRRGKLTNHKVFGEAIATLAGDALLTFAPQIITKNSQNLSAETLIKVLNEYFEYAGAYGVIGGQVVDIEQEGQNLDDRDFSENEKLLQFIHMHKTSDLFKLAIKSGAIIAGANEMTVQALEIFAQNFGLAFQICDDILDEISTFEEMGKTLGKDKIAGKLTYPALYGLENAKCKAACLFDNCYDIIKQLGIESAVYSDIIENMKKRVGI